MSKRTSYPRGTRWDDDREEYVECHHDRGVAITLVTRRSFISDDLVTDSELEDSVDAVGETKGVDVTVECTCLGCYEHTHAHRHMLATLPDWADGPVRRALDRWNALKSKGSSK